MDDKVFEFLMEVQDLVIQIENLIDKFEMRPVIMSAIMVGVIEDTEEDGDSGEEFFNVRSLYSFNLRDKEELKQVAEMMDEVYKSEDGLDDLLNGTGISLN